jgi:hypothetical protein
VAVSRVGVEVDEKMGGMMEDRAVDSMTGAEVVAMMEGEMMEEAMRGSMMLKLAGIVGGHDRGPPMLNGENTTETWVAVVVMVVVAAEAAEAAEAAAAAEAVAAAAVVVVGTRDGPRVVKGVGRGAGGEQGSWRFANFRLASAMMALSTK